ncbi:unnamed protein product [Staurois parvus]|uniref:Helix-turn-helix domain-containing protein n=1 Tax=Staurois parvus TaxID=386267 RepID=A0ABN9ADW0_9NEOB|nr:unnamed protein product [Staurois parvus]
MQTASTNICDRLCNRSIHEMSLLLHIPRSTVSGIITKWKLGKQQLSHQGVGHVK